MIIMLRICRCTGYIYKMHIRGIKIRGSPERARSTYIEGRGAIEATGDRCREHGLETEWAGAVLGY